MLQVCALLADCDFILNVLAATFKSKSLSLSLSLTTCDSSEKLTKANSKHLLNRFIFTELRYFFWFEIDSADVQFYSLFWWERSLLTQFQTESNRAWRFTQTNVCEQFWIFGFSTWCLLRLWGFGIQHLVFQLNFTHILLESEI